MTRLARLVDDYVLVSTLDAGSFDGIRSLQVVDLQVEVIMEK